MASCCVFFKWCGLLMWNFVFLKKIIGEIFDEVLIKGHFFYVVGSSSSMVIVFHTPHLLQPCSTSLFFFCDIVDLGGSSIATFFYLRYCSSWLLIMIFFVWHCWSSLYFSIVVEVLELCRWAIRVRLSNVISGAGKTLICVVVVVEDRGVWAYHSFAIVERNQIWEQLKLIITGGNNFRVSLSTR